MIVDPQTTQLILTTVFKFNSSKTTSTASELATEVTDTLINFDDDTLGQFEGMFRHSHVTGLIDDTDTSITSNITTITMGHNLTPTTTASTSYIIQFNNALYHPHAGHESGTGGIIASTGL